MNTLEITCIGILALLVFLLGANVTRHRAIRGAGNQAPTDPADPLFVAQRAHGNAAEYVPTLCVLIALCAWLGDGWWVSALAVAAVAARLAHAGGLLTSGSLARRSPVKEAGAVLTYVTGTALAVTAVVTAVIA